MKADRVIAKKYGIGRRYYLRSFAYGSYWTPYQKQALRFTEAEAKVLRRVFRGPKGYERYATVRLVGCERE